MELTRLTGHNDCKFEKLYGLYEAAFPAEERRERKALERLMDSDSRMSFCGIEHEGNVVGLLCYWHFDGFYYLEHLAVFPELRGHGIGRDLLKIVSEQLKGVCVLEAEPADLNDMARRRIGFYERNGFAVADKDYMQPSYTPEGEPFPLWILANTEVEPEMLETIKKTIVNEVYVSHYNRI